MAKIGIMGGTFDPIHLGHINIAQAAYDQYDLDYILFIPAGEPSHKQNQHITSALDRYRMVRIAINEKQHFMVSDMEIKRPGLTYSIDTVNTLKKDNSADELYFIIGADSLFSLEQWYHYEELLQKCIILVADRDDIPQQAFGERIEYINKTYHADVRPLQCPMMDISSSQIREALQDNILDNNDSINRNYIDSNVLQYIKDHQLYMLRTTEQNYSDEDIAKIQKKLKKRLIRERYIHTLGVANTCVALAMSVGYDYKKAYLAGLLHDCAKCIEDVEQLEKCEKYKIEIRDIERTSPYLLHAKLGAYYASHKYHINEEEILNAIRSHTTGKPDMGTLEMIVFVADYIEPNRNKAAHLESIRMLAFSSLEQCVEKILSDTIQYLKEKKVPIDDMTLKTYDYYYEYNRKNRTKKGTR